MNTEAIQKFKAYFTDMQGSDPARLDEIYADQVIFIDPIHQLRGIENLKSYFSKLNENLLEGSFQFTNESIIDNTVYLQWEMKVKLKRPKQTVKATGISVLIVEQKVMSQRDYFDAGELFYENIPVLGSIIRFLKRKIASS